MLSTFDANFQRRKDVEQFAMDNLRMYPDKNIGEAEYHCLGYTGENSSPIEHILGCKVKRMQNGKLRSDFTLNGRRIAAHKIALRLGELGV